MPVLLLWLCVCADPRAWAQERVDIEALLAEFYSPPTAAETLTPAGRGKVQARAEALSAALAQAPDASQKARLERELFRALYHARRLAQFYPDVRQWFDKILEKPEPANAIFAMHWQNGRKLEFAHNETASERAKREDLQKMRSLATQLMVELAKGPHRERVVRTVLDPRLGNTKGRLEDLFELTKINPRAFSRALQGEILIKMDFIRRVKPDEFEPIGSIDANGSFEFIKDNLYPLAGVELDWVPEFLVTVSKNETYPERLRLAALEVLRSHPGGMSRAAHFQEIIRNEKNSKALREATLALLPPTPEAVPQLIEGLRAQMAFTEVALRSEHGILKYDGGDIAVNSLAEAILQMKDGKEKFRALEQVFKLLAETHATWKGDYSFKKRVDSLLDTLGRVLEERAYPSSLSERKALLALVEGLSGLASLRAVAGEVKAAGRDTLSADLEKARALVESAVHNLPSVVITDEKIKLVEGLLRHTLPRDKESIFRPLLQTSWSGTAPIAAIHAAKEGPASLADGLASLRHFPPHRAPAWVAIAFLHSRFPENAPLPFVTESGLFLRMNAPARPWSTELEDLKQFVRVERKSWLPRMLEGDFVAQDDPSLQVTITRGEKCADSGSLTFRPPSFAVPVEFKFETTHQTPPTPVEGMPRVEVDLTQTATLTVDGNTLTLKRPDENGTYPSHVPDRCEEVSKKLPQGPPMVRAMVLKACVAYFWEKTPYSLREQALSEVRLYAILFPPSPELDEALFEWWSTVALHETAPELVRVALTELSRLPPRENPGRLRQVMARVKNLDKGCLRGEIEKLIEQLEGKKALVFPAVPAGAGAASATHAGGAR